MMKLPAKLIFTSMIVVSGLGALTYLLPATCVVEQSIVLATPPERVFPYLSNPTKWENWSVWNKGTDPTLFHMYGGPWAGAGARHSWNGIKAGSGQRVILAAEAPNLVQYEQLLEGETDKTTGFFRLEKVEAGTKVIWVETTPLADNPLARCKGAWKKIKSEEEIKKGLAGLKILLESNLKKNKAA